MSIDVTDAEIEKIVEKLSNAPLTGSVSTAVRRVFTVLERIRQGDPVGTVRRSLSGLNYAIKTESGPKQWLATRPIDYSHWLSDQNIQTWTIVYDPEAGK
jgi:hypothetical protein